MSDRPDKSSRAHLKNAPVGSLAGPGPLAPSPHARKCRCISSVRGRSIGHGRAARTSVRIFEMRSKPSTRQQGTAYAEALICVPIYAAVLIGLVAFNNMYSAKIEAMARARRVAWLQAESGDCPEESCTECASSEGEIQTGLDSLSRARSGKGSASSFAGKLGELIAGSSTRGTATAVAPLPPRIGDGRTVQRGVTPLPCNTKPRKAPDEGSILEEACAGGLSTAGYAGAACIGGS